MGVNEKKCRVENGEILCDEKKDEQESKSVKPVKEKCEFLIDPTTKQRLEVCTKNGKPSSARMMTADFKREGDE